MPDGKSNKEDSEIVSRVLDDNSQFALLVEKYQKQLFFYILKYIRNESVSEDIIQEAFIKMYINLRSFDINRSFSAWAYRIAHNEMVNYLRKYKATTELDEEAQFDDMFDEQTDLAEVLDKDIDAQQMHKLLDNLPMKYKEVIILHYFQNCDYESIATIIGKPSATVGTRLRRGKEQLKKLYFKEYCDEAQ